MREEDFEDILDEILALQPLLATDQYARAEYERALARVADTGDEDQRARLDDLLTELEWEAENEREAAAAEAALFDDEDETSGHDETRH